MLLQPSPFLQEMKQKLHRVGPNCETWPKSLTKIPIRALNFAPIRANPLQFSFDEVLRLRRLHRRWAAPAALQGRPERQVAAVRGARAGTANHFQRARGRRAVPARHTLSSEQRASLVHLLGSFNKLYRVGPK